MSVYVDALRFVVSSRKWPYNNSCHMVGDSEIELHAMAKKIGMKKKWYQDRHYDLQGSRRVRAIKAGAIEITTREAVTIRKEMK